MEDIDQLLQKIRSQNMAAIAHAITLVENRDDGYLTLLDKLYNLPRHSFVVGITGAPGSGKSTFVNQLVPQALETQKKVAVIAIDPSSRFTGGALLGDRIRFSDAFPFDRVFFRSLASRSSLGAVSSALFSILQIFNGALFDCIFVESVGAGQNDLDIKDYVDMVLLFLVSGMGDEVQCMKAGIMEIADLFVINKIDLYPPAPLFLALLNHLSLHLSSETAQSRIVQTDALHNTGFTELWHTIENFRQTCRYQKRSLEKDTALLLKNEVERLFTEKHIQKKLQELLSLGTSPYQMVEKMQKLLEEMLGDPHD
jgi:LAO/AO transport system kinase